MNSNNKHQFKTKINEYNPEYFSSLNYEDWSRKNVKLPCSRYNKDSKGKLRWPRYQKGLDYLASRGDNLTLDDIVKMYTILEDKESKPYILPSSGFFYIAQDNLHFKGLIQYLKKNKSSLLIMPQIAKLALLVKELFPVPIPLLTKQIEASFTLSSLQIASLLACAFFGLFPHRNIVNEQSEYRYFNKINFNWLMSGKGDVKKHVEMRKRKLPFLFNYFKRVSEELDLETKFITFHRKVLSRDKIITKKKLETEVQGNGQLSSNFSFPQVEIIPYELIEDNAEPLMKVDFANAYVGGGVLKMGAVQEEILFLIYPELIISCLFVERMDSNEALAVKGVERYSKYSGYSNQLDFDGTYDDKTHCDEFNRLQTVITCIDAIHFDNKDYFKQFELSSILRELNKAIIGFYPSIHCYIDEGNGVVSGKWGCGVFNGDPTLKFIIQILACYFVGNTKIKLTTHNDVDLPYFFKPWIQSMETNPIDPYLLLDKVIKFNDHIGQLKDLNSVMDNHFLGEKLINYLCGTDP